MHFLHYCASGVRPRSELDGPDGVGRPHQDQERGGSDVDFPKVLPRGHLWLLRHEHRWGQHPGLHQVKP
jgi:hypothetical protein